MQVQPSFSYLETLCVYKDCFFSIHEVVILVLAICLSPNVYKPAHLNSNELSEIPYIHDSRLRDLRKDK